MVGSERLCLQSWYGLQPNPMGDNAQLAVYFSFSVLYTNAFNWCDKNLWVGIFKMWGLQRKAHLEPNQCVLQHISKILAIFLPCPVKYDTMGLCFMLQAIYMWKMQGILWFLPELGCLSFFSRQWLHFRWGLRLHLQRLLQYQCSVTMLQLEAKQGRDFEALSIGQECKDLKGIGVWTPDSTQDSLKMKSVELN